jgi:hypothetical protein
MNTTSQQPDKNAKREIAREPVRTPKLREGEVIGRNGEVLKRNRNFEDQFAIPDHWKEAGWSYQWNRRSVYGKEDRAEMLRMQDNGWRPVPAERFGIQEDGNHIERDGLILMERPSSLTQAAEDEEYRKAMAQYSNSFNSVDSDASLPAMARTMRKQIRKEGRVTITPEMQRGGSIPDDE